MKDQSYYYYESEEEERRILEEACKRYNNLKGTQPLPPKPIERRISPVPRNIYLVVTTYNCLQDTIATIESLKMQTLLDKSSLLIVDNCSTDKTLIYLEEERIPHIILRGRQSVAHAWNTGMKYAYDHGAKYIFIFNNDIILEPAYVEKIIKDYESIEDCIFMNGAESGGGIQDMKDCMYTGDFSGFLVTRETIELIGYFDENFRPRYVEDNDYLHRIYLAGYKAYRNRNARFRHFGGRFYYLHPREEAKKYDLFIKNLELYYRKWGDYPKGARQHPPLLSYTLRYPCLGGTFRIPYNGKEPPRMRNCIGILQLGRLGDIIATTPIALHYQYLEEPIEWIVSYHYSSVLKQLFPSIPLVTIMETRDLQGNVFGIGLDKAEKILEEGNYLYPMRIQIAPHFQEDFDRSPYSFIEYMHILG